MSDYFELVSSRESCRNYNPDRRPTREYAHIDIGLSVSQLCYAATQQGLSTCIMGSFDQKMLLDSLGITEPKRVLLVIAVGYAATDALRPKKRKPLDELSVGICRRQGGAGREQGRGFDPRVSGGA